MAVSRRVRHVGVRVITSSRLNSRVRRSNGRTVFRVTRQPSTTFLHVPNVVEEDYLSF